MLTGTPITRWNDDMFPFLCRADLDGLKRRCGGIAKERFDLRYTVRQKRQFPGARFPTQMVVGNKNTDELAQWIYGEELALRVDLKEVFENMPPLTQNRYTIKMDADAALKAKLKQLETMPMADIRKQLETKEPALATVRRELGLAKVKAAAEEIADRIESGQNVLVGAWHTEVIDALQQKLHAKGYEVGIIDGRVSSAAKQRFQDSWNAGKINALVCQIAAAGVSLNLQHGGTQIIVVEEDWSPSIMDQFYARLWRYGQEKHVHVDTLMADTKLDKALARISATKQREHAKFNRIGQEMNDG
jgi:SNF2 family DNA or RNA helicase